MKGHDTIGVIMIPTGFALALGGFLFHDISTADAILIVGGLLLAVLGRAVTLLAVIAHRKGKL